VERSAVGLLGGCCKNGPLQQTARASSASARHNGEMLNFRPGESPSWLVLLFEEADESRRQNCAGGQLVVEATDLPFTPGVAWRSPGAGEAAIFMTAEQTRALPAKRRYFVRLQLELPGEDVLVSADIPVFSWRSSADTRILPLELAGETLSLVASDPLPQALGGPSVAIRFSRLGARGLPGRDGVDGVDGAQGPPGPPPEDPGDLTLIFENHLV